ncbi:Coagulation factor VIII [Bienertia sinuspersici]
MVLPNSKIEIKYGRRQIRIEFADQKSGGSKYLPGAAKFTEWRVGNGLIELPSHGPAFTWCNNREGKGIIYEQLDRAYCNEQWRNMFPEALVVNHEILASDHGAILLETPPRKIKKKRPYKIEAVLHVQDMRRQEAIAKACRSWCIDRKRKLGITWDIFTEELGPKQAEVKEENCGEEEILKRQDCLERAKAQHIYWKQRAKITWDKLGDQCTNFFFRSVKMRKGRNWINAIKDEEGTWIHGEDKVRNASTNISTTYFLPIRQTTDV